MDDDTIVIVEVFAKKSAQTPKAIVNVCKKRLRDYDAVAETRGTQ